MKHLLQQNSNEYGTFFIDLKTKEGMHLYYGIKERFEYRLDDREQVISDIARFIKKFTFGYDNIYIPQSSSDFLIKLMENLGVKFEIIYKNKIENVIAFQETLPLQKKERKAHQERFKEMGEFFKINLMKANQRRYYHSVIFDKIPFKPGKNLVIDDSCFSGTTFKGIKEQLSEFDFISIFSK